MKAFFVSGGARRAVACCLVAAAMVVVSSIAAADDIVTLIQGTTVKQAIGKSVRGQIQSESPTEVVVQLGATNTSVPLDQIASIRYDGQSASYALAEARESSGLFAEAAELFKKAATESGGKPFPTQLALFREAEILTDLALVEPARVKDAKDKLTAFIKAYPASRHIVPARECLARVQLQSEDYTGALATIVELGRLPKGAERATVLRTSVLAKQGKHDQALAELEKIITSSSKNSSRRRAALLAKAESLAGLKKFSEAETLLHEVIEANPPEDALAQAPAYNTLGDCMKAANRPKDALLAYLHTDLLYSKDKVEHPRALYNIVEIFRQLKQDGRADEFAQKLKQEYPKSPWSSAQKSAISASGP
jgi:tetratricopeptide (TPR) repeat protein